jgi:2-oxoglutarate ferredoxin oxidoreductase subunit beta
MTYIAKPKLHHPSLVKNKAGYTRRDYEGAVSTLCAGCGHDSISAAIIQACYELDILPHQVAKLSGIGCSSKAPTYFVGASHGFNTVHGRMPSVMTGANLANRDLIYMGVSGDGDSASIGLGQFAHIMRRGVNMTYIVMNNGVYGLTKGQFSASADVGSTSKKGETNVQHPIDPVLLALTLGATFVARSFSGDKAQLIPILKAGLSHNGLALIDIISPCVTFNDHEGSTKSYKFTREHEVEISAADFVPLRREIKAPVTNEAISTVTMHDGSVVRFRKTHESYDPTNREAAYAHVRACQQRDEVATGLLFIDEDGADMHAVWKTVATPLVDLTYEQLCPGNAALQALMEKYR